MTKIKITRGVPASGKSTWALQWVREQKDRLRLNRDEMRDTFFGKRHGLTPQQEKFITKVQVYAARQAVRQGFDGVVVDATNMVNKFLKDWFKVGAEVEFVDFPIDLEEAIRRDAAREHSVGENVIRKFHSRLKGGRFPEPPRSPRGDGFRKYDPETVADQPYCILVDVDGTLAHNPGPPTHRNPYDFSRVAEDQPIRATIAAITAMKAHVPGRVTVIAFSGRDDSCRNETLEWFEQHGVPVDRLYMRATGDRREDAVVKHEMFWEHVGDKFDVLAVFDDREAVCRMWHEIGLPLLRVGDPESDF